MATLILPGIALLYTVCAIVYRYVIHPTFISPLSQVPAAHPTVPFCSAWILWKRFSGKENATVLDAHKRLGPLVRLGPSEISVNCVNGGIRTVRVQTIGTSTYSAIPED